MSILDFKAMWVRAKGKSDAELEAAIKDCRKAALMAEELEEAGYRVLKTGGYYMDEASVYEDILRRRQAKAGTLAAV